MRIAAIGSRSFANFNLADRWLSQFIKTANDVVVSGGAIGADSISIKWARSKGYQVEEYLPNWNKYGKKAGIIRNKNIIDNCDMVLCFWDGKSKGSQHSLNLAKNAKKPTIIVYF